MDIALNRLRALPLAAALGAAGCASTQVEAPWSDPQRPPNLLHGARVMIACEAPDLALKKLCQDQLASELVARNATPVPAPELGAGQGEAAWLAAAGKLGVRALWLNRIGVAGAGSTPTISIGLGAFGLGGGNVRGGVGVSAPVAGGQTTYGFALEGRVSDVRSGRLSWSARATAPPSKDADAQLRELTRKVFDAADQAQLF